MSNLNAKQIYDLSLQQIAAESFWDFAHQLPQTLKVDHIVRIDAANPAIARPSAPADRGRS